MNYWEKGGVKLPNKTKLRMVDGSDIYDAVIRNESILTNGKTYASPSAAAIACTGKSSNGWIHWLAKRPDDKVWTPLSWLKVGLSASSD